MKPSGSERSKVVKSDGEWRAQLTPEQYHVTREHGTERAFTGPHWDEKGEGLYRCVCCGAPLFSKTKYDSGTGLAELLAAGRPRCGRRARGPLLAHGRTEIRCARCDAHLGHVFLDGPKPTGMRYCLNGTALRFEPGSRG